MLYVTLNCWLPRQTWNKKSGPAEQKSCLRGTKSKTLAFCCVKLKFWLPATDLEQKAKSSFAFCSAWLFFLFRVVGFFVPHCWFAFCSAFLVVGSCFLFRMVGSGYAGGVRRERIPDIVSLSVDVYKRRKVGACQQIQMDTTSWRLKWNIIHSTGCL